MPLTKDGMIVTGGISYKLNGVEVTQKEYIEETNRRFRENQAKLLMDFVEDFDICLGNALTTKEAIEKFLDERSKNE